MELIVDFGSDLLTLTEETEDQVTTFVSNITPNNFLAALDFFKHNEHKVLPELLSEIDYSVAEY